MGALTDIQIGIQPCVYTEYRELIGVIAKEQEELSTIEKEIIYIKTKNIGVGSEEFKRSKLERMIRRRQELLEQLESDKSRYKKLADQVNNITEGIVEVHEKIYPGSKIVMGNISRSIDYVQSSCCFVKRGEDIYADELIERLNGRRVEHVTKQEPKGSGRGFMYGEDTGIRYIKRK